MAESYLGFLNLSLRVSNCLRRAKIFTIEDLINKSEAELLALPNFGQTCLNEINDKLSHYGIAVRKQNTNSLIGLPDEYELDFLNLSVRATNCLINNQIYTIEDLQNKSEAELLALPNFGKTSLNEINDKLNQHGLAARKQTTNPSIPLPDGYELDFLNLSVRATNCLINNQIYTIEDLQNKREAELLALPNFGQTSLNEINDKLKPHGYSLREPFNINDSLTLHASGSSIEEIANLTHHSEQEISRYLKTSMYLDQGMSFREMGEKFDITHEAARRYASRYFPLKSTKEYRKKAKDARRSRTLESERKHQEGQLKALLKTLNIDPEEVISDLRSTFLINATAEKFGLELEVVKELNDSLAYPVDAEIIRDISYEESHSDEELLEYLRITFNIRRRIVTRSEYEIVALQNRTEKSWPSFQTYLLRFGTWINACEKAQVPSRERREYERVWTDEKIFSELISFVKFCRKEGKKTSGTAYESWAKSREAPSLATVRKSGLGRWPIAVSRAKSEVFKRQQGVE